MNAYRLYLMAYELKTYPCDGKGHHPHQLKLNGGQLHETQFLDGRLNATDEGLLDTNECKAAWPVALGGGKGDLADWIVQLFLDLDSLLFIRSKVTDDREKCGTVFDRFITLLIIGDGSYATQ